MTWVTDKIAEIRAKPAEHHHSFSALIACCMNEGALDLTAMDAHEKYAAVGDNGGKPCDVTNGPCSCGAWH